MRRPKQTDLPDEVRAKFPASFGTLKLIKVLTCKEFADIQPKKPKLDEGNINEDISLLCLSNGWDEIYYRTLIESKAKQPVPKKKEMKWREKRASCSYCVFGDIWIQTDLGDLRKKCQCLKKFIEQPDWRACRECTDYEARSGWQLHVNIVPIETGDIELPSIHSKRLRIKKSKADEDIYI